MARRGPLVPNGVARTPRGIRAFIDGSLWPDWLKAHRDPERQGEADRLDSQMSRLERLAAGLKKRYHIE